MVKVEDPTRGIEACLTTSGSANVTDNSSLSTIAVLKKSDPPTTFPGPLSGAFIPVSYSNNPETKHHPGLRQLVNNFARLYHSNGGTEDFTARPTDHHLAKMLGAAAEFFGSGVKFEYGVTDKGIVGVLRSNEIPFDKLKSPDKNRPFMPLGQVRMERAYNGGPGTLKITPSGDEYTVQIYPTGKTEIAGHKYDTTKTLQSSIAEMRGIFNELVGLLLTETNGNMYNLNLHGSVSNMNSTDLRSDLSEEMGTHKFRVCRHAEPDWTIAYAAHERADTLYDIFYRSTANSPSTLELVKTANLDLAAIDFNQALGWLVGKYEHMSETHDLLQRSLIADDGLGIFGEKYYQQDPGNSHIKDNRSLVLRYLTQLNRGIMQAEEHLSSQNTKH